MAIGTAAGRVCIVAARIVAEPARGFDATQGVGQVRFSPDGAYSATDEAGLTIRDAVTGAVVAAHREPVACDQIRWVSPETILTASSYGVYTWQFTLKPANLRLIRLWTPLKGPQLVEKQAIDE